MNTSMISRKMISLLVLVLVLAACAPLAPEPTPAAQPNVPAVGLANPADVYCQGLGYSTELVERNGGQDSDCLFPDDTRCAAWDLLAGRCGQEFSYCQQQGGTIAASADSNIGTCTFNDGSSCSEIEFYAGDCKPGDNIQGAALEGSPVQMSAEPTPVEIKDFVQARDFIADYLLKRYGVGTTEAWGEQNITSPSSAGTSTLRYVAGAMTITLQAEASAPYATLYTIQEASDLSNGFYWEGTLSFDGIITETRVVPASTILSAEQARDAVLAYLATNSQTLIFPAEWVEGGQVQTIDNTTTRTFTSGDWTVKVAFTPSAPLVDRYSVTIENLLQGLRWEGGISSQAEITEISYTS